MLEYVELLLLNLTYGNVDSNRVQSYRNEKTDTRLHLLPCFIQASIRLCAHIE